MKITKKFKNLTKFTYVLGDEHLLEPHLPKGYTKDQFGNYFLKIGDSPSTMFTCHLDTAAWKTERVKHVFTGKYIKTDGTTILGADDKAGMVILLYMIENKIPGLYYFFIGEESGCVGSSEVARIWKQLEYSKYITKCVSFDRRGLSSVITSQLGGQCCSDDFAKDLCDKLNSTGFKFSYKPDDTGIFTDSAKFMSLIPECTNISVGYYSEHTQYETQDMDHLIKLCKASVKVDWESLVIKRDLLQNDYINYYFSDEDDDFDEDNIKEDEFTSQYYSSFIIDNKIKRMFISKTRINSEIQEIESWLKTDEVYCNFSQVFWNGETLEVEIDGRVETIGSRTDLIDFIPYLKSIPNDELRSNVTRKIIL